MAQSQYKLADSAKRDFREIIKKSGKKHGSDAAIRYHRLLLTGLEDVGTAPKTSRTLKFKEQEISLYHTRHSAKRAKYKGIGVKKPRHFIVYRMQSDGIIEIMRILYDGMNLEKHIAEELE